MPEAAHDELAVRTDSLVAVARSRYEQALALTIRDNLDFEGASNLLLETQTYIKEAEEFFREPKRNAKATHDSICAKERLVTDEAIRTRSVLRDKMSAYILDRDNRLEEENQRKREAEAQKHAESIERQIEEAERYGASGEEVRAILAQQSMVPVRPVQKAVLPVRGITARDEWYGVITDKHAFVTAALTDDRIFDLIEIPQGKLNVLVKTLKGTLRNVPGLSVEHRPVISASRQGGVYR
jgi:hypothetical protein